jgi:uncharacterized OB-fold protein
MAMGRLSSSERLGRHASIVAGGLDIKNETCSSTLMESAETGGLSAPYVLEYTYRRSLGPVIGRFLSGLREGRIEGVRTASGRVLVPPVEYDPESGEPIVDFVPVSDTGVVTTWAWVGEPRRNQPLQRPFAWALIRLDGADTALLHAVDVGPAGGADRMATGMRVRVRWSAARVGAIQDIACFEPAEGGR